MKIATKSPDGKMPLNLEFLYTIDVPISSTQDWKYQSLTREECLKIFSFLLTKIVFFSIFNCSIIDFVGSLNSWNQTKLISTLCPAGILWTLMNNDISCGDHFIRPTDFLY